MKKKFDKTSIYHPDYMDYKEEMLKKKREAEEERKQKIAESNYLFASMVDDDDDGDEEDDDDDKASRAIRNHRNKRAEQSCFDDSVYSNIPDFLKAIIAEFETSQEKQTALYSCLILFSGIMPRYSTIYNSKKYYVNLFGFVYGGFGAGKGVVHTCKSLLHPLHRNKLGQQLQTQGHFGSTQSGNIRHFTLLIPGNITKASMYQTLSDNNGEGIIVETEADTLTAALRGEHGKFSDVLRVGFEHESLSLSRKMDGSLFIEEPRISMLLSGTPKQVKGLINDIENGLFSRLTFIKVESNPEFKNVFEKGEISFNEDDWMSDAIEWLYDELSCHETTFSFTESQQEIFYQSFRALKESYREIFNGEMDGVLHRFGIITTRICMILTMLRTFDLSNKRYEIHTQYYCTDEDFKLGLNIGDILLKHTEEVYSMLTEEADGLSTDKLKEKLRKEEHVVRLAKQGLTHRAIATTVYGKATMVSTVNSILKRNGYRK